MNLATIPYITTSLEISLNVEVHGHVRENLNVWQPQPEQIMALFATDLCKSCIEFALTNFN